MAREQTESRPEPRLAILSGSRAGETVPILGESTRLGRGDTNEITVPDAWLSSSHCLIRTVGAGYLVKDLESLNGTYVNGESVTERELNHGDRLRLGATEVLFLVGEDSSREGSEDEDPSRTLRMDAPDSTYFKHGWLDEDLLARPRTARDLDALRRLSHALTRIREPEPLQKAVAALTLEVCDALEASIVLVQAGSGQFFPPITSGTSWGASADIDYEVAHDVLRSGVAMLAGMSDRPDSKAEGRLICAPLATLQSRIGVLYVSRSSSASPFDSHDLEFLTAFGSVAGVAIDEVRTVERLQEDRSRLLDEVAVQHEMVGESASMRAVYDFIGKAAPADSTVLIEGESGTGKELVAWAIHQNSLRANGPFVAINCAALPADLLESELFGYEKGAFTGANALKKGRFEAASGGTLFLDEIAELPIGIQAKLLRVVQTRSFERLGGVATINADVRIVAATNRNLRKAKDEGRFREDLYFRINVVAVALPPLRDRREDIRPLAEHFARRMAAREGRVLTISPQTHHLMANYDWPGNVRELENAIERAVVLGAGDELMPDDLPETLLEGRPSGEDPLNYQDAVNRFKREHILRVIHQTDQLRDAARLLGIHPNNLSRLIRQLELRPDLDEAE